jgi:hypothetical protein
VLGLREELGVGSWELDADGRYDPPMKEIRRQT